MDSVENLQFILSRIASYICKIKNDFELANVNINVIPSFIKIHLLFIWDCCIDIEAINTLAILTQKRGLNEFFELNCAIKFQQRGKNKEIGVTKVSFITTEQQEFLLRTLLPKPITTITTSNIEPIVVGVKEPEVNAPLLPAVVSKKPARCLKPYSSLSRMGKSVVKRSVQGFVEERLGPNNTEADQDDLLCSLLSKEKKRKLKELNESPSSASIS